MRNIEGEDLKKLITEAKEEFMEAQRQKIKEKIFHILGQARTEIGSIYALENQIKKAKERLDKENEKLKQLESGNWEILPEGESKKEKSMEKDKEEKSSTHEVE